MTRAATRNVIAMLITENYSVKPRPNDRNISTQRIATLLGTTCSMLLATVVSCCDMLGVVHSNLKMVIFFMLHDVVVIWPGSCNNFAPVHGDCVLVRCRNMLQQVGQMRATCQLPSTMLRSVAFKCCDRLPGACKCWANNVGICCVEMLLSFGGALATGSANILPVQVKYESDNITKTRNENRSSNSDFLYRTKTEDEKRKWIFEICLPKLGQNELEVGIQSSM